VAIIAGKDQHHDGQGCQCCSICSRILARGYYFPTLIIVFK